MFTSIKNIYKDWKELKTWQKILLFLPYLLICFLILLLLFMPRGKNFSKKIIKNNKQNIDNQIITIDKKENDLKDKQEEIKNKRKEIINLIENEEKEYDEIIKEINDADDDIHKLIALHERINAKYSK